MMFVDRHYATFKIPITVHYGAIVIKNTAMENKEEEEDKYQILQRLEHEEYIFVLKRYLPSL